MALSSGVARSIGSWHSARGGFCWKFEGRKASSLRVRARASSSLSATKCATPLLLACTSTPPSCSVVTFSRVTCFTTLGPVRNMWLPRVMATKSVRAGL